MKVRALSTRKHFARDCRKPQGWIVKPVTNPLARPVPSAREAIDEALLEIHEAEVAQAPMGLECEDCYRTDVPVYAHGVRSRNFRPYFLCRACAEDAAYVNRYDDFEYVARTCACCNWDSWGDAWNERDYRMLDDDPQFA